MKITRTIEIEVPDLGDRIRDMRVRHQKSGTQLAAAAGITYSSWWKVEKGRQKTLPEATLRKIEQALGCSFGVKFPERSE